MNFRPDPDTWYVLSFEHSGHVLAVADASTASGANIRQEAPSGERSQQWRFEEMETGWYRIRARHSDMAIGIAQPQDENGANLHQWSANDNESQQWSLTSSEGGYLLNSRHSGKLLTVAGASLDDGGNVQQWGTNSKPQARVRFTAVLQPASDSYYTLLFEHSGKALSVAELSKDNGVKVVQDRVDGSPRQQWSFEEIDTDWYVLRARHSGKALDVSGVSTENGAVLHQWNVHSGENQQWRLVPTQGGYLLRARHSGRVIDVGSAGTADGTKVQQYGAASVPHRRMRIVPRPAAPTFAPEQGAWYHMIFAHSGLALDVRDDSDGAVVYQHAPHFGTNQLFTFESVEGEWYRIRVRSSGMVLDVADGSTSNGADVGARAADGGTNQQWKIVAKDDTYAIIARHSNRSLNVQGISLDIGANVQQWDHFGSQNAQVHITRITGALPDVPPRGLKISDGDEPVWLAPASYFGEGSATVEAWVRPDADTGTETLIALGDANHQRTILIDRLGDDIRVSSRKQGTTLKIVRSNDRLSAGAWTHVAVTIKHSTVVQLGTVHKYTFVVYINGEKRSNTIQVSQGELSGRGDWVHEILQAKILSQCTIGGKGDGSDIFHGKIGEVRLWRRALGADEIASRWNRRARGDEDRLTACYRLDRIFDGRVSDHSRSRAHATAGAGLAIGNVGGLPLGPTTAAEIRAEGKLTREWLPKAAFSQETLEMLRAAYSDLAGLDSLSVADLGPTSGDRVEVSVYEVVLRPCDADGAELGGTWIRAYSGAELVVIVDDDAGPPTLTTWSAGGRQVLKVPNTGRLRLRFVATSLASADLRVWHPGMPRSVYSVVRPDEDTCRRMLELDSQSLLTARGRRPCPLGAGDGATEANAEKAVALVAKFARVGVPAETLRAHHPYHQPIPGIGMAGLWGDVEDFFKDVGDALEDAGGEVWDGAWGPTMEVVDLVATTASDLADLVEGAAQAAPRFGKAAIRECIANASSLDVVTSAVDEFANVVQMVGKTGETYWRVVITKIADALEAVGAFFKRLGGSVKDFIDAIAGALDWGRFLAKTEELYSVVTTTLEGAKSRIDTEKNADYFGSISAKLAAQEEWPEATETLEDVMAEALPSLPGTDTIDYVLDQLARLVKAAKFDLPMPGIELPDIDAPWLTDLKDAIPSLEAFDDGLFGEPLAGMVGAFNSLWEAQGEAILGDPYKDLLGGVSSGVNGLRLALTERIDVPWLTELIEQTILGGEHLCALRLFCLLAAIPIVLVEGADDEITNFAGNATDVEITIIVFKLVNSLLTLVRSIPGSVDGSATESTVGARLAILHGLSILAEGALEIHLGSEDDDGILLATGIINTIYGTLLGGVGALAAAILAGKGGDDLTASESADLGGLSAILDTTFGLAYVGVASYCITATKATKDVASLSLDVAYWPITCLVGGVVYVLKLPTANHETQKKHDKYAGGLALFNCGFSVVYLSKSGFDNTRAWT